jgi:hypothetical protein
LELTELTHVAMEGTAVNQDSSQTNANAVLDRNVTAGDVHERKKIGEASGHAWKEFVDGRDLEVLALDLRGLLEEVRITASKPEHFVAAAEILEAEAAARSGNCGELRVHLAKAGSWSADLATATGGAVPAAAIRAALCT